MYEYLVMQLIANANFKIADASDEFVNVILDDTSARYLEESDLIDDFMDYLNSLSIRTIQYTGYTEYTIDDIEGNFTIVIYNLSYINE